MQTETQSLLIRLVMHPTNNPHLIDKLIILRGLPYEWVFKKSKYKIEHENGEIEEGVGDNLLTPWEADSDINIPREVRDLTEPITFVHWFPSVSLVGGNGNKQFSGFWDKRTVWGLKLDYSHGPAQELWTRIEEFIDKTLERGQKMPEAVVVAQDQKSPFKTFLPRRGRTLSSLEFVEMEVPVIDLRKPVIINPTVTAVSTQPIITMVSVPTNPEPPVPEVKEDTNLYKCEDCNKEFEKAQALRMHRTKMHRKEKAKV